MKKKFIALILIGIMVLTLSTFVACTSKHAYLIEGIYECENVDYDGKSIDKIVIGVREITDSDYYIYDPHIVEREDKVFYIDFDIWIDGEQIKKDYKTSYEFKLKYFYISVESDNDETLFITFVTEKDDEGNYYISAKFFDANAREFMLKKCE